MAITIIKDGQVAINGYKYNIDKPLMEMSQSPMPSKLDTGDKAYAQENYLSNWIQKDRRGGILIAEMDESIHSDRLLWTDCNIDNDGHTVLPRLATEIDTFTGLAGGWHDPTSYVDPDVVWTDEAKAYDGNTGTYAYEDISGIAWGSYLQLVIAATYCESVRIYPTREDADITTMDIDIYYDGVWTNVYSDTPTYGAYNTVTFSSPKLISQARIRFYNSNAEQTEGRINDFDFGQDDTAPSGTIGVAAEYNSESWRIIGNYLCKLDSGRASYSAVQGFHNVPTALVPSLNSRLYIFAATGYYSWMSTSEVVTVSKTGDGQWGVENAGLLYKLSSTGVWASSADPDGATPTWNDLGDITNDVSKIEGLFRGRDASGNYIVYCATNAAQLVYDATNDIWQSTELRLPDHPNGGKGATYWNDGHYFSYGLGVKRYVTGTIATITEVGLDRDDGLMAEYNGEIVKFCADSDYFLSALVDASQTSGNTQSGLYVWDGRSWKCWWADPDNNGAMHDITVSSAESGYAIYWDCGGSIFYIDIPRGLQNPRQLTGVLKYASSGILISSWFDADTVVFPKLVLDITSYARSITTTEKITIKYRLNHLYEDRDTGWETLVVLDSAAENGAVETSLASGAGLSFDAIQYRLDLARGGTNTSSPDLLALVTSYLLRKASSNLKTWNFTVLIDGEASGEGIKEQYDNLWTAINSSTLVPLVFRDEVTPHYVLLYLGGSETQTGEGHKGRMALHAVEV